MDVNDLHKFYEANLPEYERRDVLIVTRFFLRTMGEPDNKPYGRAGEIWLKFRDFVALKWQGVKISTKKIETDSKDLPVGLSQYGFCDCGGKMVKRQNKAKGNFFLGCTRYPKCTYTEELVEIFIVQ